MLTRLKVKGFKNLVDVDVHFGAFTCIAGANGVGKSNLFDAIQFLSALADKPLLEAAQSVRAGDAYTADIRNLFQRIKDTYNPNMSFEVEMIIPQRGEDDLGQPTEASITFVRYQLELAYHPGQNGRSLGAIEITHEQLEPITSNVQKHLFFDYSAEWEHTAITGSYTASFISTEIEADGKIIKLHQDGISGNPRRLRASNLPRTVLSSVNAAENPTVLLARREMQSWRLLQLEPSALRKPDKFTDIGQLGMDGAHLPATIETLAHRSIQDQTGEETSGQVYSSIANRVAELIEDVRDIYVDKDDIRQRLTLYLRQRDGTSYPAHALSDGTLRFLALTVLEQDDREQGLICLEEPENGIHPGRISAMLSLLKDIAVDVSMPVDADNPLRQVIINTHSPAVVQQVPDDSLLIMQLADVKQNNQRFKAANFGALPDTWREKLNPTQVLNRASLLAYLKVGDTPNTTLRDNRVIDREDMQQLLLPFPEGKV